MEIAANQPIPHSSPAPTVSAPILDVQGVSKRFGGLKALDDVNLSIAEHSIHAIIGPNGAGKSTLLNVLIGLLAADEGTVTFAGEPLKGLKPHSIIQKGIARVFQTPQIFPGMTLIENVNIAALGRRDGDFRMKAFETLERGNDVVEETAALLKRVGLERQMEQDAGALSRGDKRRLELAICLAARPRLLLLDEPTAGMSRADTNRTIDLLAALSAQGDMTMVIIEHDMHVVFTLAQRISVLAQGHVIVEGEPNAVRGDERVQEAYLGGTHRA